MKTRNLLLGFGFFIYTGLIVISFFHNGSMVEAIKDLAIGTIGVIVGYIISYRNSKKEN